jgi:hypothetical protein
MTKSIMAQLPNDLIMNIIRIADGGLHTHKQKLASVLESIKSPHKFHEEFDGKWFGHFKNKGRNMQEIENFWLGDDYGVWTNHNLYVEDPLELEQMAECGLYEVLSENYIDEGSILGLWG